MEYLKNRWGSDRSVNVNVNVLKAPEDIIDYIILHELCHSKLKEHSHEYWDYIRRFMPNSIQSKNYPIDGSRTS